MLRRILAAGVVLALMLTGGAVAEPSEDGKAAYDSGETMRLLCCCGDRWRNGATPPPNTIFIILAPNDMDNVVAYILSLKD